MAKEQNGKKENVIAELSAREIEERRMPFPEGRDYLYDSREIERIIPHRYPFLMIDRVIELVDNYSITAIKNVSYNEPYFTGHFPGHPVMPGVLILEAMAQAGAILAHVSKDGVDPSKTVYFVGANEVKFRRQVLPGDVLSIQMHSLRKRRPVWIMRGTASINGKIVASGDISAAEA